MKQNTKERCLLEESTLFSEIMKKPQQIEAPNVKLEGEIKASHKQSCVKRIQTLE